MCQTLFQLTDSFAGSPNLILIILFSLFTVQLNSNLTLMFDRSRVFTNFIPSPRPMTAYFCGQLVWCHEFDSRLVEIESLYKPPYEFHRGNTRTRLDSWNTRFLHKSFFAYNCKMVGLHG